MMGRNTTRHGVEGSGSERELFSVADDTGYVRKLSFCRRDHLRRDVGRHDTVRVCLN